MKRVILLSNDLMAFVSEENWKLRERTNTDVNYKVIGNVYRLAIPYSNPTNMTNGWKLKGVLIAENSEIRVSHQNVVFTLLEAEKASVQS